MKDIIRSASFASFVEGNVMAAHCQLSFVQFYRWVITHLLQETCIIIWLTPRTPENSHFFWEWKYK